MSTTASETLLNHWIGGRRDEREAERHGEVSDPATGEIVARVPFATTGDVDRAVQAATKAAKEWGAASLTKRAQVMFRFRELVAAHKDELAALITREHGKVLDDARGEVTRGLEVVEFACGLGHLLKGENTPQVSTGVDSHSMRMPLGVVAGITPFNFPVMVPLWMAPVALACGNAFILKPSEQDPSPSMRLAELLAEAGLPDGVFSVVHGDKEAVDAILTHPGIAGGQLRRLHPGRAPHLRDRHGPRQARAGARRRQEPRRRAARRRPRPRPPTASSPPPTARPASAAWPSRSPSRSATSPSRCWTRSASGSRSSTSARAPTRRPTWARSSRRRTTTRSPGSSTPASRRAPSWPSTAATSIVEGHEGGYFLGPCVFDNVRPGMRVYDEEIFGPVLVVVRADSYPEALELVNANEYGNGAAIFTCDGGAARLFEQQATAGMIGVNVPIPVPMAYHSFGGWKGSLFGDLHMHGPDGVRFYTRGKVVTTRWPDPATHQGVNLGFPTQT